jgi:ankyrin repeat protein
MQLVPLHQGARPPRGSVNWLVAALCATTLFAQVAHAQGVRSENVSAALKSVDAEPAETTPSTALADAAQRRDRETVVALIDQAENLDSPGSDGTPALHWLVLTDDLDTAARLLDAGADPGLTTRYGVSPLSLAAGNGNAAMIRLLIEAGADPNAPNAIGEPMLMAAAESGEVQAVVALLEHGARVDERDTDFAQTALMVAARGGETGIARVLLEAGADPNAQTRIGETPDWILPNSRPGFSFGIGIIRGGLPADRGMRPFIPGGMTPLHYAARHGFVETAEVLLDSGAKIDANEANKIAPLLMAISNNQIELALTLIERGANIESQDWYGRSPLWSAVNVRNLYVSNDTFDNDIVREPVLALIRTLLDHGANPNVRTTESPPVRQHLLSITGTLEWVDFTGQTPFLAAALAGDVTVMRLLLEHSADPHLPSFGGTTALMAAAGVNWVVSQSYTEGPQAVLGAVMLCLELGMDVNAINSMGIAAIHGAANRGSDDIIELLVTHGASLDVADNEGRTPLDWARGVFLATHPAEPKPSSVELIEQLSSR